MIRNNEEYMPPRDRHHDEYNRNNKQQLKTFIEYGIDACRANDALHALGKVGLFTKEEIVNSLRTVI